MYFLEQVCEPFLRRAQNSDGGWGYRPGATSAVEPTCCALLALESLGRGENFSPESKRGCDWLAGVQLQNGSWPPYPGQEQGSWVTGLACLALQAQQSAPGQVEKAARWLTHARPGTLNFLGRVKLRLSARKLGMAQNPALYGWSWTAGTSSWVEPTAVALIALRQMAGTNNGKRAASRRRMGEELLLDRMCPGGGWNCGNPMVYGTPGMPLIGPTAWALFALAGLPERDEVRQSLEWLERSYSSIRGPGSLAQAHLCLETFGRILPALEPALQHAFTANEFFEQVPVMAWAALALSATPNWLRATVEARG